MRRSALTYLLFNLNAVIDADAHKGVTFDDVRRELERGSLWNWLKLSFSPHLDVSIFEGQDTGLEVARALRGAWDGVEGA